MGNKKVYGSSVVSDAENVLNTSNVDELDSDMFPNEEISESDLSDMRSELKTTGSTEKQKETIVTDAISGIKNSSVDDEDFDKIIEAIDEQDIRGKKITNSGLAMIKDLLKEDPTDDEIKHMSEEFTKWTEDKEEACNNIKQAESALGERVMNKLKEISGDEYERVAVRFASQVYNTFQRVVQYNDDMKELSKLAKIVNDYNLSAETNYDENDFESFDKEFKNLIDVQDKISEFMSKVSKLDDRNKRLRQDYSIDDYDIRTVESVRECLDTALDFRLVKNKILVNTKKFKKDFKDETYVNSSIENWINDIRNDANTIFTFPVNDFLTLKESRDQMEQFLYTAIVYYNLPEIIPDPGDKELGDAMLEFGMITEEDNNKFKKQAKLLLFVLSRTFKHKKLSTDNDRRILSYTLDIISKLGVHDHRERVVELANWIYEYIYTN